MASEIGETLRARRRGRGSSGQQSCGGVHGSVQARPPRAQGWRGHGRIPTCVVVLSELRGAYGVSCRARAMRYATNCGDSPPQPGWAALGPPLPLPVRRGTRHNEGHRIRYRCKMHHIGRSATFLPTSPRVRGGCGAGAGRVRGGCGAGAGRVRGGCGAGAGRARCDRLGRRRPRVHWSRDGCLRPRESTGGEPGGRPPRRPRGSNGGEPRGGTPRARPRMGRRRAPRRARVASAEG